MAEYILTERVISDKECKDILAFAKNKWETGRIHQVGTSKKTRDSDVVFLSEQKYFHIAERILRGIYPYLEWQVNVDTIEPMQITRYKVGQYYGFHTDGNGFERMPVSNKVRKLSMSILLNDKFEGGEFEFINESKVNIKKGCAVIFPSWIPHRVNPVTKGVRYSLVVWHGGEPVV